MLRILTFAVSRLNKSLFNESFETIPLKDPASYFNSPRATMYTSQFLNMDFQFPFFSLILTGEDSALGGGIIIW